MQKIELRKVRDFGELFNDAIAFLRLNFKSFFGCILVLAGPFIFLTGLLSGYLQSLQSKLTSTNLFPGYFGSSGGLLSANFTGTLAMFFLIFLLTTMVTTAVISLYFKFYDKAKPEELPVKKEILSPYLAGASWRLFYNFLLLIVIFFVAALVMIGISAVLLMIPLINILVGIAIFVAYIIFIPVLFYVLIVANFIIVRDEVLVTEAIRKAVEYMRGNFWWTWLLVISVGISTLAVYAVFNLPLLILTLVNTFTRYDPAGNSSDHSMLYVIFGTMALVGQLLVIIPLFSIFFIMNFYNHEERHEGTGLLNRIDDLDQQ